MATPRALAVVWGVGALVLSGSVEALPSVGEQVPLFTAKDLLNRPHATSEWRGQRVLLVAITEQHAGDEMRRWFDAASARLPEEVHRASILSLDLPFFVSTGLARDRAKEQVPRQFWSDTWLDKDGEMARTLMLATSRQPYVLALDEEGQVLAGIHGTVDSPDAHLVWEALDGTPPQ